ncbi:M28 family peptidase [Pseudomonas silesiensis]|jgi:hypothetical protein|uniref:M28 family peptidase n=1 Tax=Pseudomonas silesiensis TaxID=1853130 RepID=UPI0030CE3A2C
MLQNDTDFTAFRKKNITGWNFAVVEGFQDYHRMSDTVENLERLYLRDTLRAYRLPDFIRP